MAAKKRSTNKRAVREQAAQGLQDIKGEETPITPPKSGSKAKSAPKAAPAPVAGPTRASYSKRTRPEGPLTEAQAKSKAQADKRKAELDKFQLETQAAKDAAAPVNPRAAATRRSTRKANNAARNAGFTAAAAEARAQGEGQTEQASDGFNLVIKAPGGPITVAPGSPEAKRLAELIAGKPSLLRKADRAIADAGKAGTKNATAAQRRKQKGLDEMAQDTSEQMAGIERPIPGKRHVNAVPAGTKPKAIGNLTEAVKGLSGKFPRHALKFISNPSMTAEDKHAVLDGTHPRMPNTLGLTPEETQVAHSLVDIHHGLKETGFLGAHVVDEALKDRSKD